MEAVTTSSDVIEVKKDYCSKCRICISLCPFEALTLDSEKQEVKLDLEKCQVCGICYSSCPASAIESLYYDLSGLEKYIKEGIERYKSTTLAIACRGSVADNENLKEIINQNDFIPLWLPCLGRTPIELLILALSSGINKIMLVPCKDDFCRFEDGSRIVTYRILLLTKLLQQLGYDRNTLTIIKYAPKITIDKYLCISCATCFSVCPYDAINMGASGFAEIDQKLCHRCGRCLAYCPGIAIDLEGSTDNAISTSIDELSRAAQGDKVLIFKCIWAQFEQVPEISQQNGNLKIVDIPCAGRIDFLHVLEAYQKGIDAVIIVGCEEDSCRLEQGSKDAKRRISELKKSLDHLGVKNKLELKFTTPKNMGELNGIVNSLRTEYKLKTKG